MRKTSNRNRIKAALSQMYYAALELKAIGYDDEDGIGLADSSEVRDAEHRLDEIALALRMVLVNMEPVHRNPLERMFGMKD
jgi:hypothetical protein